MASLIPEPTRVLGAGASEQEVVRLAESGALQGFDVVHLATHAFVDHERPESPALDRAYWSGLILIGES